LVPDDNSELSDKALSHAVYLSNLTGAEIVILNVAKLLRNRVYNNFSNYKRDNKRKAIVDDVKNRTDKKDIQTTLEGQAEQTVKER
jgi:nucleotide-binding universal stress UspA family protein